MPFLETYCIDCHGDIKQEGDFRVDTLTDDFSDLRNVSHWIEVRDNINLGEMPPEDEIQPYAEEVEMISEWAAAGIREAERLALAKDGRILLRRLNRREYANSIRDLLHIDFLPDRGPLDYLPPDGTAEGFDKVSAALMLDPSLMNKYYEVARLIADQAIVDGPPDFPTKTMRMEFEDIGRNRAIDYLCDQPGFDCFEDHIEVINGSTRSFGRLFYSDEHRISTPTRGLYRISVRAGARRGPDGEPVKMRVAQSHPDASRQVVMELAVEGTPENPETYSVVVPRDPDGGEWNVAPVNPVDMTDFNYTYLHYANRLIGQFGREGDFTNAIRYRGRLQLEGGHEGSILRPDRIDTSTLPMLHLDWIEIEGPLYEQWPPKSHEVFFPEGTDIDPTPAALEAIFAEFLPRAFRRPVERFEIDPYVAFVRQELEAGRSIEQAMRAALAAVLTSPHFLYLFEPSDSQDPRPLSDWEIASRLSYFLWSSAPDDELLRLASAGQLSDPETITAQIDRMVEDPRIEGLVEGFAAQWLRTDTYRAFQPDARQYKNYDAKLGEAMVGESHAFFREILRNDLDLRNFLDSDWTMLNERLAAHYGIPGVKGDEFRPVKLPPDSPRGGILGQAGVHMAGSDGDRTKPVSRGVYVLEVLFNDPPDPPPPNAGEIEPNIKGEKLSVKERLIQHQQIESCAACHRGIDPYGVGLENFNVIGEWREHQDGEGFRPPNSPEIDPGAKLPNGNTFATFDEFKSLLSAQDERFFTGLTEKMLVYALGRPTLPTDRGLIEDIAGSLGETPTLRQLLKQVATSRQFLEK